MVGPGPPKQRAAAAAHGPCVVPDDALVEMFGLLPANSLHRFKCVSKAWCGLVTDPLHCQRYAQTLAGFLCADGACESCRRVGSGAESSRRTCPHATVPERKRTTTTRLGPQRLAADGAHVPALRRLLLRRVPPAPVPAGRHGLGAGGAHLLVIDRGVGGQGGRVARRRVAGLGPRHGADPAGDGRRGRPRRAAPGGGHRRHVGPQQPGGRGRGGPHAQGHPAAAPRRGGGLALGVRRPPHGRLSEEAPLRMLVWVLRDYDAGEWVLRHAVGFPELFGGRFACQFRVEYSVVAVHPDGNWVFFVRHWDRKLVAYDMDRREVRVVADLGPSGGDLGDELPVPYYVPLYKESAALTNSKQ
ncbi:uncharacterized protein [Miscanthus floridulus]|uniref:uncharacterized protein n=1 Tax=Miscanthus floridulus TaxID=154761 RepID=UPI00345854E7